LRSCQRSCWGLRVLALALLLASHLCAAGDPLLLHRYSFDDAAGSSTVTDTADVSAWGGTQKNGAVVDTVGLGNGKAAFTGAGYLRLPDNIMESSTAVTMEMWLTVNSGNAGNNRLFQFGATNANPNSIILHQNGYNGPLYSTMFLASKLEVASTTLFNSLTANSHVVAVYDPVVSATFKIHVNGAQVASDIMSSALSVAMGNYNYVGTNTNGDTLRLYGVMDEFRVWRGALSASTIAEHYSWGPSSLCAAGYEHTSVAGASGCTACPQGKYGSASAGNGNSCTPCDTGYTGSTTGAASASDACTLCAAGYEGTSVSGTSGCTECATGTSSQRGYACGVCASGSHWVAGVCTPCSAGKYQPRSVTNGCIDCGAGKASDAVGAASSSTCVPCDAGKFAPAGAVSCTSCAAGSYSVLNSAACVQCPAGRYASPNQDTCEGCNVGTFSGAGASICTDCAAGYYSKALSSQCAPCRQAFFPP